MDYNSYTPPTEDYGQSGYGYIINGSTDDPGELDKQCVPPHDQTLFVAGMCTSIMSSLFLIMFILLLIKNWSRKSIDSWMLCLSAAFVTWTVVAILENTVSSDICSFTQFIVCFLHVFVALLQCGMSIEKFMASTSSIRMQNSKFTRIYLLLSLCFSIAASTVRSIVLVGDKSLSAGYATFTCWSTVSVESHLVYYSIFLVFYIIVAATTITFHILAMVKIYKTRLSQRMMILFHMLAILIVYISSYVGLAIPGMINKLINANMFNCDSTLRHRYYNMFVCLPMIILVIILIISSRRVRTSIITGLIDVGQSVTRRNRSHHIQEIKLRSLAKHTSDLRTGARRESSVR